jgi:ribonuclease BN (tRNA processing enzyme)
VAYRLDAAGGSVCYSGDSGACPGLVALARGCDVLIHMNHYFSGRELSAAYRQACGNHRDNAAAARDAGVRTLVLTHLSAEFDDAGVRERALAEIREIFDGEVVWGEDLMELTL